MSDAETTVRRTMSGWHPWRVLRSRTHVELRYAHLPEGVLGLTKGSVITLAHGLLQSERRCTATHELIHEERGDGACASEWHEQKQERSVEQLSARRLITHEALVDKLRWTLDEDELAEELWVDRETVVARLTGLTEAEKQDIYSQLWGDEASWGSCS